MKPEHLTESPAFAATASTTSQDYHHFDQSNTKFDLSAESQLQNQLENLGNLQNELQMVIYQLEDSRSPPAASFQHADSQSNSPDDVDIIRDATDNSSDSDEEYVKLCNKFQSLQQEFHALKSCCKDGSQFMDDGSTNNTGKENDDTSSLQKMSMLEQRIRELEKHNMTLALAAATVTLTQKDDDKKANLLSESQTEPSSKSSKSSSAAVDRWKIEKKYQKKIEDLQKQVEKQTSLAKEATASQDRLKSQIERLQNDLSQRDTAMKALSVKLTRLEEMALPGGSYPASAVRSLLAELSSLQGRYDTLERQIALHQRMHVVSSTVRTAYTLALPPATIPTEESSIIGHHQTVPHLFQQEVDQTSTPIHNELKILGLELERDQAKDHVTRLEDRIRLLFEEDQKNTSQYKGRKLSQREKELLDTIALLRGALEKTKKGLEMGVSSSKYMHAVEKAKQAARRAHDLEAELQKTTHLQEQLQQNQKDIASAHVTITALRTQIRDLKQKIKNVAVAKEDILIAQIAELERAIRERDAQLALLQPLSQEYRLLMSEGLTPRVLVQQLIEARSLIHHYEQLSSTDDHNHTNDTSSSAHSSP